MPDEIRLNNDVPDDSIENLSDLPDKKNSEPKPILDTPVTIEDRLNSVDVLRGFALFGILVINIAIFGLPNAALKNPIIIGNESTADVAVWAVSQVVFFQKFLAIFSMLFGAGLILMYQRAEAAGKAFGKTYYRRLGWLILLGLIHAYFIWWGDILFHYALSGLILYPMRCLSSRKLITFGVLVFFVGSLFFLGLGLFFDFCRKTAIEAEAAREAGETVTSLQESMSDIWKRLEENLEPSPENINEEIANRRCSYWSHFVYCVPRILNMHTFGFVFFIMWRIVGLMMIGMGLMKLGVFGAGLSRRFYLSLAIFGYGIGLPIVGYNIYRLISSDFYFMHIFGVGAVYNHIGILFITGGHIGLVMLVCKSGLLSGLRKRLAAVGRMALTNYLMHSIILSPVFYGFGLGLFGQVGYFGLMGFVLGIWILQLYLSPLWLQYYRFGPVEWLWRSLTYKKRQPMKVRREMT